MVVDILFSILILFIGISGSKKGFLDEISEFIGIGLAIWLVMSFYVDLTIKLHSFININMELTQFFSAIIIFIITIVGVRFITSVLSFLYENSNIFSVANQLFGFLFGILKGILLLVVFLWFFDNYISNNIYTMLIEESKIISLLNPMKDCINQSITIPL
jgi:membrane protein required for colicin V production|tara:strand:- start:396 stop:875 length:480 start_codon:yes stop_codon:yes gene_type:complete